jgi:3-isopropylmalate/(R)-2-methylmalate dehydratase small subunit
MTTSERRIVTGPAIAVRGHDIDTDRIIPARFLKCVVFDGLGEHAFADDRAQLRERGEAHPFDDPRFAGARILLVNRNFGCGSSREHAPQAIMRWGRGIEAIVGESFAEIFAGNCLALGMPCVTVAPAALEDLMTLAEQEPATTFTLSVVDRTLAAGSAVSVPVAIPDGTRHQLVAGTWDTTSELLAARDDIARTAARLPYVSIWGADRPRGG